MGKTVCVIPSRYASTRLPGKALCLLGGKPLLWHVVTRASRATTVDEVVVATGEGSANQPIVDLCREYGWYLWRGSEADVLGRVYDAATEREADVVVRVTGDCPLCDPEEIDRIVHFRARFGLEVACNIHPPMLPDGLDVEVASYRVLTLADRDAHLRSDREHVFPWLYRSLSRHWWMSLGWHEDLSAWRLTIDTEADLAAMRAIVALVGPDCDWRDALRVLREHPEIRQLNAGEERNSRYLAQLAAEGERDVGL